MNRYTEEEERLCDLGAAELLMPEQSLRLTIAGRALEMDLLKSISRAFDVCLLAASRRVVECADRPLAVVHRMTVPGLRHDQLRPVQFSKGLPGVFLRAPEGVKACLSGAQRTIFQVAWPGSDSRRIVCETVALPGGAGAGDAEGRPVALSLLQAVT